MMNGGIKQVAFIDLVHPYLKQKLEERGVVCHDLSNEKTQTIIEKAGDYDGIVIRSRFPVNKTFLDKAIRLKFIARSGAGMENINMDYAKQRGIALFNSPEGNRTAVAEHALGMLLSLFNNLNNADSEVRSGVWNREGNRGIELKGKTVAIIGYGNMGSSFAKRLEGFGVDVIAYDKYKKGFGNNNVLECDWDLIYKKADVVSLHVPLAEDTQYLMNKSRFDKFEKPIFLINTARGNNVKISDLLDAIKKEQVLGACLDVMEFESSAFENVQNENKDFKNLMESKKVILSPHVAGWTKESYYKLSYFLYQKISDYFFEKE